MHKLKSLRQALIDAIPQLNANPERLQMSVGGGNIDTRQASSISFEKRYALNAKVSGFTGDSEGFFVPVLAWLRENQPDIFTLDEGRKNGYTFAVVLNDDDTMDITISVQLTERILVSPSRALCTRRIPRAAAAGARHAAEGAVRQRRAGQPVGGLISPR